ncbi:MAG TPA: M42 family metallopeptidase [Limnochordales bacterium]
MEEGTAGTTMALLTRLSQAVGVSGHERDVAELVGQELRPFVDEVRTDRLGNCVGIRRGQARAARAPRILLAAHLDEIGMVVSRIERGGFLRVLPIGGVNVQTLLGRQVVVHAADGPVPGIIGHPPPHLTADGSRAKLPRWDELFVDCGLSGDEAERRISVGDLVTVAQAPLQLLGDRLAGKALDNRASVAAVVETMRRLQELRHEADVYAVATVQEEVGLRGATVSAFHVEPDVAIAVDVTFARQRLVSEPDVVELGKGPAIAIGANMHPRVVEALMETAREHGIPYQVEAIPGRSGTDAWAIQVSRQGVPTGLVSVPLRYMHGPTEVVQVSDVQQTARLLAHFVARVHAGWVEQLAVWE